MTFQAAGGYVFGGAGFDYKISDNFAIFIQAGYNLISSNNPNSNFYSSINALAGINLSLFKSKTL